MLEVSNLERKPGNTLTMDIHGTKYIIDEFLNGNNTINDIIATRIKRDITLDIPRENS